MNLMLFPQIYLLFSYIGNYIIRNIIPDTVFLPDPLPKLLTGHINIHGIQSQKCPVVGLGTTADLLIEIAVSAVIPGCHNKSTCLADTLRFHPGIKIV